VGAEVTGAGVRWAGCGLGRGAVGQGVPVGAGVRLRQGVVDKGALGIRLVTQRSCIDTSAS